MSDWKATCNSRTEAVLAITLAVLGPVLLVALIGLGFRLGFWQFLFG